MRRKSEEIFREENIWKAIGEMAVPSMFSILVMILYNIADMFFVGQTGDTAQVAAVSVVGPVFSLMMSVGSMLGSGACMLMAQDLGRENREGVKIYSSLCCWGAVLSGAIFSVLLILGKGILLNFLGANEEIWHHAENYFLILAIGAPVMTFSSAFSGVLRAEGAARHSMRSHMMGTLANVVLDPLFILVLEMGISGAAVATVLSNVLSTGYLLCYVFFAETSLSVNPRYAMKRPLAIGKILYMGMPNAVNTLLSGFASGFANRLLIGYGTNAVAAMGAASKSTQVISLIQMGLCMGVQPLLAFSYGAKDWRRIREVVKRVLILTVSIGGSLMLICLLGSRFLVAAFLKDNMEAIALGRQMISLRVLTGPFLGVYFLSTGFLQSSGQAQKATLVSTLRQGIFFIPLMYFMNHFFGVVGNICGHIVADAGATAVGAVLAVRQYRKVQREQMNSAGGTV